MPEYPLRDIPPHLLSSGEGRTNILKVIVCAVIRNVRERHIGIEKLQSLELFCRQIEVADKAVGLRKAFLVFIDRKEALQTLRPQPFIQIRLNRGTIGSVGHKMMNLAG